MLRLSIVVSSNPSRLQYPGFSISEHMPLLAQRADRYSVIRSRYHGTPSHEAAIHWTLTGYDYPEPIPPPRTATSNRQWVRLSRRREARIGPAYRHMSAFQIEANWATGCVMQRPTISWRSGFRLNQGVPPVNATSPFPTPPNLSLAKGTDLRRLEHRLGLLRDLDQPFHVSRLQRRHRRDWMNLTGKRSNSSPTMSRTMPSTCRRNQWRRQRYGNTSFAQRLVLARHLGASRWHLRFYARQFLEQSGMGYSRR